MLKKPFFTFLFILTALIISACTKDEQVKELESYTYENKVFDPADWNTFDLDDDIILDGKLDDSPWSQMNSFSFSNTSQTNTLSVKSYFGEKGVYFGFEMNDSKVFVNTDRLFWKNDSVELYLNSLNRQSGPDSSFAQVRIDPTGRTESWVGIESPDGYPWSKYYIPMKVTSQINGTLNPTDDETSEGYSIEVFIPWEGLLLEGKPEKLSLVPAFVESDGLGPNDFEWNPPVGATHTSVGTYLDFGPNGYIERTEGNLFGDYSNEVKYTKGFDLSQETTKVQQNGAGDQFIYFKDVNSTHYMYSVSVRLDEVLNNDQWPKAGVIIGDDGDKIVNFFFDPLQELSSKTGVMVTGNSIGDRSWQWGAGIGLSNNIDYTTGVKVTVIRDEEDFYVLINGELLVKEQGLLTGSSTPGLFTMNMAATFSNYSVTEDTEEISNAVALATRTQGEVFGDSLFDKLYTQGFDFSNEKTNVTQTGQGDQWIYFKDVYSSQYMFSVDVELGNSINNDPFPKVGVIIGENLSGIKTFLLDPLPNKDNYYGIFVPRDTLGEWQWGPGSPLPYQTDYTGKVNIQVIRDHDDYYVLVDGFVVDYRHIDGFGDSQPGLFTMNHEATYSNYSVTEDETAIDLKVVEAKSQFVNDTTFENGEAFQGSVGFDLSDSDNQITQNLGQDKWTYFKEIESSQYMFTTTIQLNEVLNHDAYPKAGVIIGDDGQSSVHFLFDTLGDLSQKVGMVVKADSPSGGWQWPGTSMNLSTDIDYKQGVEVTVIRNNNDYYVIVDGTLVYQGQDLLVGNSKIGLFTMNMAATYSNYSVTEDTIEIQTIIDGFEIEDGILGNAPTGAIASPGYDVTDIENDVVLQTISGEQIIYFTNLHSTKYIIEASFLMGNPIDDPFSKIGLLAATNDNGRMVFLADTRIEKYFKDVMAVYQPIGGDWDWGNTASYNGGINYDHPVHLKVIRNGENFYFFVNGVYMFNRTIPGYTDASVAGLITMGQQATFTNFSVTEDEGVIDQEISKVMISNDDYNWSGEGDIVINGDADITFVPDSANTNESNKYIFKDGVTLQNNFFIEYNVANITVSQDLPDWMWPKLSLLLINDQGNRNYIGIGAANKQMRLETMIDGGWQNGVSFPEGTNLVDMHTIRLERIINPDDTATFKIYFDGVLQTFNDGTNRTTNYLGTYTFGFTGDFAAGEITGITYGQLN